MTGAYNSHNTVAESVADTTAAGMTAIAPGTCTTAVVPFVVNANVGRSCVDFVCAEWCRFAFVWDVREGRFLKLSFRPSTDLPYVYIPSTLAWCLPSPSTPGDSISPATTMTSSPHQVIA